MRNEVASLCIQFISKSKLLMLAYSAAFIYVNFYFISLLKRDNAIKQKNTDRHIGRSALLIIISSYFFFARSFASIAFAI